MCGAAEGVFRFDCAECRRRMEDAECRELRDRLFPLQAPELPQ
jgi:hypothetical protein